MNHTYLAYCWREINVRLEASKSYGPLVQPQGLVPSQEGKILVTDEDLACPLPKWLIWELTYPNVIVLSRETLLYFNHRWIYTPHASKTTLK